MELFKAYGPEIIAFCAVFAVLSFISFLWNHSKIFKLVIGFLLFRALMPLVFAGAMYVMFFFKH